jgi:hypothetical protein
MKLKLLAGFIPAFIAISVCQAQQPATPATPSAAPAAPVSKYDYRDEFAPFFYSKNGNEYRAADGQPGPKYWQNHADY